ncbi:MAG TPA: RNA-binding protein [Thermoanaerobaculia bacterium]
MKVYVGNLSADTTQPQLTDLVTPFGHPDSVTIATDKHSGASRGFAFVEFANDDAARAAIAGLDGKEVNGKALRVNESHPKPAQHRLP